MPIGWRSCAGRRSYSPAFEASPHPPDSVLLLHRVAEAAQHVLKRYDGWLKEITTDDKGTTLIGVFGVAPFSHEDDPARAIRVALALQAEIRALGFGAGAGIATGLALCGPLGSASRRDFAVLGRHVNLAARLLQASGGESVLCDVHARSTPSGQSFERLPAYVLKGLAAPIDVFRVNTAPQPTGSRSAIVDRTSELAAAIHAVDAVSTAPVAWSFSRESRGSANRVSSRSSYATRNRPGYAHWSDLRPRSKHRPISRVAEGIRGPAWDRRHPQCCRTPPHRRRGPFRRRVHAEACTSARPDPLD